MLSTNQQPQPQSDKDTHSTLTAAQIKKMPVRDENVNEPFSALTSIVVLQKNKKRLHMSPNNRNDQKRTTELSENLTWAKIESSKNELD